MPDQTNILVWTLWKRFTKLGHTRDENTSIELSGRPFYEQKAKNAYVPFDLVWIKKTIKLIQFRLH